MNLGSAHGEIAIDYTGQAAIKQAMADLGTLASASKSANIGFSFETAGKSLAAMGGAIEAPLAAATKMAIDFGANMANVNSILQLTPEGIEKMGNDIQALSPVVNKAPAELAAAMYDIASSGFAGQQALDILTAAAKGANAGLTDTATSGRAITAVMNAFGPSAGDAAHVSDILFQTVKDGVLTFDQLANNMGNTIPIASALGIPMEQLGAAYATLTTQGINASAAETDIAAVMRSALNPTKALTTALDAQGTTAQEIIAEGGLPAYLKFLQDAAQGDTSAMFDLVGSQEAMNGVTALGVDEGNRYLKFLDNQEHASEGVGAAQAALNEQMQGTQFVLDRLKVAVNTAGTALGETLEGGVRTSAAAAGDLLFAFSQLDPQILKTIGLIGSIAGGVLVTAGGAALLGGKIFALAESFETAGLSLGKFVGGLGILGVLLAVGVAAYTNNWFGFGDAVDGALGKAGKALRTFSDTFSAFFKARTAQGMNGVAAGVNAFGNALQAATGIDITPWTDSLSTGIQAFGDSMQVAIAQGVNPLQAVLFSLSNALSAMGFDDLAAQVHNAEVVVAHFGNTFARTRDAAIAAGYSDVAADVMGLGAAIQRVTGLPVAGFFADAAHAVQVFGNSFETATNRGLNPLDAALNATRDTIESITQLPLGDFFNAVGDSLTSARTGLGNFIGALQRGDLADAADQAGTALRGFGDAIGETFNNAGSAIQAGIASIGDMIGQADLSGAVQNIGNTLAGIKDALAPYIPTPEEFSTIGTDIGSALGSGVVNGLKAAGGFKDFLVSNIGPILKDAAQSIGDLFNTMLGDSFAGEGGPRDMGPSQSTIMESIKNLIGGLKDGFVAEFQKAFAAGDLPTPDAEFILAPLRAMIQAAADAVGDIFQPLVQALERSALDTMQALDQLPDTDLSEPVAALQEQLFGMSEAEAALNKVVVTGAGGGMIPDSYVQQASEDQKQAEEAARLLDATVFQVEGSYQSVEDVRAAIGDMTDSVTQTDAQSGVFGKTFEESLTNIKNSIATIPSFFDTSDFPKSTKAGITDGILDPIVGAIQDAGDSPKVPDAAEQTGGNLVGDYASSLADSIDAADVSLFAPVGEALQTKVQDAIIAAVSKGTQDVPSPGLGAGAAGEGMGAELIAGLATSLADSVASAPVESFAEVGTALTGKINDALTTSLSTPQMTDAGTTTAGGSMATTMVQSLATQMATAIQSVETSVFDPVSSAMMSKITESLSATMNATGMQGAQLAGSGDVATNGAGIGSSLVASLATSIADSITAAKPETFMAVGQALSGQIQAALSIAMTAAPSALMDGGKGMTGTGTAGANLGGGAEALMLSIATQLADSITAADPETFAAVGQALSAKIQEVLSSAFSGGDGGGKNAAPGQLVGAGAGGSGIGQQIAASIASSVQGANFEAVGQAIVTNIGIGIGPAVGTLESAVQAMLSVTIASGMTAATAANTIGTQFVTMAATGVGAATGTFEAAVDAMISVSIAKGVADDAAATEIGSQLAVIAGTGIGGATGGFESAVTAMVTTAIAAGVGAAAGASAIGAAVSAGAASGVILTAMNDAVATMVANGIAAGMAAADASSPSKVAMEELGQPIAEGAAIGVEQGAGEFSDSVSSMMQDGLDAGVANVQQMIDEIRQKVDEALKAAGLPGIIADDLSSGVDEGMQTLDEAGQELGSGLTDGVQTGLDQGGNTGSATDVGASIPTDIASGIDSGAPDTCQTATDLGTSINDCLSSTMPALSETATGMGSSIPTDMASGIDSASGDVTDAAGDLGQDVSNEAGTAIEKNGGTVKDAATGVGQDAAQGMAEGVDSGASQFSDSVGSAMDQGMSVAADALEQARSIFEKYGMTFGNDLGEGLSKATGNLMGNANLDRLTGLEDQIRSNVEERTQHLRDMGDRIRERFGLTGGEDQTITVQSTGQVMMDDQVMGDFTIDTVIGSIGSAQRKGGKRMATGHSA